MKKLTQRGFGLSTILIAIVAIGLVATSGYLVYQRQQDKKDQEKLQQQIEELKLEDEKQAEQTKPAAEPEEQLSEDDQIIQAAGCEGAEICEIKDKTAELAWVGSGDGISGITIFVAKTGDTWSSIYKGNGDPSQDQINQYSIPKDWLGPSI